MKQYSLFSCFLRKSEVGDGVVMANRRFFKESCSNTTIQKRRNHSFLFFLAISVCLLLSVAGDDTDNMRSVLKSLCSLNSQRKISSCCSSYNIDTDFSLEPSPARSCFISSIVITQSSLIQELFVFYHVFACFYSFFTLKRGLRSLGITALANDVFSSLTNLASFFFLLFFVFPSYLTVPHIFVL